MLEKCDDRGPPFIRGLRVLHILEAVLYAQLVKNSIVNLINVLTLGKLLYQVLFADL